MPLYMLTPKHPTSFDDYDILRPRYLKVARIEVLEGARIRFFFYDPEDPTNEHDLDYITLKAQTSEDAELIAHKYSQYIDRRK